MGFGVIWISFGVIWNEFGMKKAGFVVNWIGLG